MSLSIKTNAVKFLLALSLGNREAFFFCPDIGTFFCIPQLNVFKGTAKSSVFFVENSGSLKYCWENRARFYFSARSQQNFLASDFPFHAGYSM